MQGTREIDWIFVFYFVRCKALTKCLHTPCSHLAKRLKSEGHYIVACDWKRNEHMPVRVFD